MAQIRSDIETEQMISEDVNLFSVQKTDVGILDSGFILVSPSTQIGGDQSEIDFNIAFSSGLTYMNLNDTTINVQGHFARSDGSPLKAEDKNKVSHCNLLTHSLFSDVEITMGYNQAQVSQTGNYGIQAYLKKLLMSPGLSPFLANAGFEMDLPSADTTITQGKNSTLGERATAIELSKKIHFEDTVQLDIFRQHKLFPCDVPIKLRFILARPAFYTITPPGSKEEFKFVFEKMQLKIPIYTINPEVILFNGEQFEKQEAVYPVKRHTLRQFTIPIGNQSFEIQTLERGIIPERIFMALAKTAAVNGKFTENPYFFGNYDVSTLKLYLDGKLLTDLSMDFSSVHTITEAYSSFLDALDISRHEERDIHIYKQAFRDGGTVYGVNLAKRTHNDANIAKLAKHGTLSAEFTFKNGTTEALTLLVLAVSNAELRLDMNRKVTYSTNQN